MKSNSILGGLAGACALTLIHETVRRVNNKAPRMDRLGMEALSGILKKTDTNVPSKKNLFMLTLAADIIANTAYYSFAAAPGKRKATVTKGALLGLAAGIGALALPKPLGLSSRYSNRTVATHIMTTAWYLFGGLVSSAALKMLEKSSNK